MASLNTSRWWDAAVLGVSVLFAIVVALGEDQTSVVSAVLVTIGAFVVVWFAFGRVAMRTPRLTLPYTIVLVIFLGVLTSLNPNLASFQALVYPMLWSMAPTVRFGILASAAGATSVGIGFWFVFGSTVGALPEIALIVTLSLGFSIAMGLWITHMFRLADEREVLLLDLQAAQESLAALHRDAGVTSERERLAREIHDTIAQDLTGLVMLTQQARRSLAEGLLPGTEETLVLLEENARLALSETRALVAATSPAVLDDGGIGPALERLASRFTRETGIPVATEVDATAPLSRATEVVLLRCTQEGLANVRKHSGADSARLSLSVAPHGTVLTIEDSGTGFDPASVGQGFGLTGMRDRLALEGGQLEIESSPAGTRLVVSLPAGKGGGSGRAEKAVSGGRVLPATDGGPS
ncbi:MAG: sensor histidine kinase [Rhodoglobus sp.]